MIAGCRVLSIGSWGSRVSVAIGNQMGGGINDASDGGGGDGGGVDGRGQSQCGG